MITSRHILLTCEMSLQLMAEEQGLVVSLDGFNQCMEQQRERSRVTSPLLHTLSQPPLPILYPLCSPP